MNHLSKREQWLMFDGFNRRINYLRISVTDRCNLRCIYCMPAEGIPLLRHEDILSYDEITEVVRTGAEMGITKVRITGGEPLVRKGVIGLVKMIAGISAITDMSMTTNGTLLEEYVQPLADAGLQRVNVSLDTTNPEKYRQITRLGDIKQVFRGLEAAKKAGLDPVKINCVVKKDSGEPDALAVKSFAEKEGYQVRFIREMNLRTGDFSIVEGGDGGNCMACNRLRLTANGKIKPCLFSDLAYDVRELGIVEAINLALKNKPEAGIKNMVNTFNNIGG